MKKILTFSGIITFLLLICGFVQAITLKVSPAEINIKASPGFLIEKEMVVSNPGDNAAIFEVYTDSFSEWIKIKPASFNLESGASKRVNIAVKNREEGLFSTNISVLARPLGEKQFKTNSGVKIPLTVSVSHQGADVFLASLFNMLEKKISVWYLFLALAAVSIFWLALFLRRRKRQN